LRTAELLLRFTPPVLVMANDRLYRKHSRARWKLPDG
jgi:hypothetical protein